MSRATGQQGIELESRGLGRLMPLHLCLDAGGRIISVGPTLAKIFAGRQLLTADFFEIFEVRRPVSVTNMAGMHAHIGLRLSVVPRNASGVQSMRGVAVPLADEGGVLINLSFGIGVIDAVATYRLTDADFAVTDLAMEMLYLVEAKTTVTEELRQLNLRLQGARDAAEEKALTDTLTGLRNRRALDLALTHAIDQGVPFGLMHVDLDYFKTVNDTLGHAAGDYVLREVGQKLSDETRKGDTVARVGGDEFVLQFVGLVDPAHLSRIADRIVARLSEPMLFEGRDCRISASIGITISTDYDPPEPERMQSDADTALYASKHAGRGKAFLFGAMPGDGVS